MAFETNVPHMVFEKVVSAGHEFVKSLDALRVRSDYTFISPSPSKRSATQNAFSNVDQDQVLVGNLKQADPSLI